MERSNIIIKYDEEGKFKIGNALKQLRLEAGISSQQYLGDLLNRDRTGLSKYESAKIVPSLPTLHEIAQELGYDIELVFKPKENNKLDINNCNNNNTIKINPNLKDLKYIFSSNLFQKEWYGQLKVELVKQLNYEGINIRNNDIDEIGFLILSCSYTYATIEWYEKLSTEAQGIMNNYIDISQFDSVLNKIKNKLEINYKLNNIDIVRMSEYICFGYMNERLKIELLENYISHDKEIIVDIEDKLDDILSLMIKDIVIVLAISNCISQLYIANFDLELCLAREKDKLWLMHVIKDLSKRCLYKFIEVYPNKDMNDLVDTIKYITNINSMEYVIVEIVEAQLAEICNV